MAFDNGSICECGQPNCEVCKELKSSQIGDLRYLFGKDAINCDRYMPICRIGSQLDVGIATRFVGEDATGCLVKDIIHVRAPIIGDGTAANPIDIDFSLDSGIDECNFGSTLDRASPLRDVVGRDANGCLRWDDARTVAIYTETPFVYQNSITIRGTTNPTNGHTLTTEVVIAPAQLGVSNQASALPTGLYVPTGAGIDPRDTATINHSFSLLTGILTSDVKKSTVANNVLSLFPDGLHVAIGAGATGGVNSCIQVQVNAGVITASPILSPAQGGIANGLSCTPQGLYVSAPAIADTNTVDMTADPAGLRADVKISTLANNSIVANATGIYAPSLCSVVAGLPTGTALATGSLVLGNDCQFHALPAATITTWLVDTPTSGTQSITNGDTLLVSGLNGIAANLLGKNLQIDYDLCGQLQAKTQGAQGVFGTSLFFGDDCRYHRLPIPDTQDAFTPQDSSTVGWAINGPFGHSPTAEVKLNPDPVNIITETPTGLFAFASAAILDADDSPTINFTTSGVDSHTITGDVKISGRIGNRIFIDNQGLFVDPQVFTQTPITPVNSTTLQLLVAGVNNHDITGSVVVSPQANNSLTALNTGMYVPSTCSVIAAFGVGGVGVAGTDRYIGADCLQHTLPAAPTYPNAAACAVPDRVIGSTVGGVAQSFDWSDITPPNIYISATQAALAPANVTPGAAGVALTQAQVTATITNPSGCKSMKYVGSIRTGRVLFQQGPIAGGTATGITGLATNAVISGPGAGGATADLVAGTGTIQDILSNTTPVAVAGSWRMKAPSDTWQVSGTIPPGGSATYTLDVQILRDAAHAATTNVEIGRSHITLIGLF